MNLQKIKLFSIFFSTYLDYVSRTNLRDWIFLNWKNSKNRVGPGLLTKLKEGWWWLWGWGVVVRGLEYVINLVYNKAPFFNKIPNKLQTRFLGLTLLKQHAKSLTMLLQSRVF